MYSEEEVISELNGLSVEQINEKYSKKQLQCFFKSLYRMDPRSNKSRLDLAWECWNYVSDFKRTKDLCKIFS